MAAIQDTVDLIVSAETWNERVARLRQVPQRRGTDEHATIDARVASRGSPSAASQNRWPPWAQGGGRERANGCGQGDRGGGRDVLADDAPQCESGALDEHHPGPG